jgi:hypothetical protein
MGEVTMARDRICYPGPARSYVGDAGIVAAGRDNRLVVTLEGCRSWVFVLPAMEPHADRWFEVFRNAEHIDVITRQADEFTNAVADGYFAAIVRRWGLKTEGMEDDR